MNITRLHLNIGPSDLINAHRLREEVLEWDQELEFSNFRQSIVYAGLQETHDGTVLPCGTLRAHGCS